MRYALMRRVSPVIGNCELTYLDRSSIDPARADQQHREVGRLLEAAGLTVITLPADPKLPDSTFVEDAAIVLDELAVITNPGAPTRRAETEAIASVLGHFRTLHRIEDPGTVDGGDVVRIGRTLYVGIGTRTNQSGLQQLASIAAPVGYNIVPIPVSKALHLKTAATWLGNDTWLINPDWIDPAPLDRFRLLPVPPAEPWAANALSVDDTVLLPADFPQTLALLSARGYGVTIVETDELRKAESGLTCLSIIFEA